MSDVTTDEKFDPFAHANLLKDLKKLDGKEPKVGRGKAVRVASETSSALNIGSFLKKIERQSIAETKISAKAKTASIKTLRKPLEKPVSRRLKRAAGFESVAVDVNKWEGLVNQRRNEDQLTFPLDQPDVRIVTSEKNFKTSLKSELEKDVYSLLTGARLVEEKEETAEERQIQKAMSLKEIRLKSQEMWKARNMRQRLERKAALFNKSKSRKYHKILKRDRLRKMKQNFEQLKLTDPEAALEVLDEIEKSRVEERMSLRHRKSKWLQAQGVRAGRDKMAKDVLKENADVRIDLLEKMKLPDKKEEDSDYSEDEFSQILQNQQKSIAKGKLDPHNAWVSQLALPEEVIEETDESFLKMKKFWEEVHQRKIIEKEAQKEAEKLTKEGDVPKKNSKVSGKKNKTIQSLSTMDCGREEDEVLEDRLAVSDGIEEHLPEKGKKGKKSDNGKVVKLSKKSDKWSQNSSNRTSKSSNEVKPSDEKVSKTSETKKKIKSINTNKKSVSDKPSKKTKKSSKNISDETKNIKSKLLKKGKAKSEELEKEDKYFKKSPKKKNNVSKKEKEILDDFKIDSLFDNANEKINDKVNNESKLYEPKINKKEKKKSTKQQSKIEMEFDFTAKETQGLDETVHRITTVEDLDTLANGESKQTRKERFVSLCVSKDDHASDQATKSEEKPTNVTDIKKIVSKKLGNSSIDYSFLKRLKDSDSEEEIEEDLQDLFEDDENINEFRAEKESVEEKGKPKDISLYLQGWGSWAGPGIVPSKKKMEKFKITAPSIPKHKYSKIGNVIYNEGADVHSNIRKLMVSDLPHPFLTVKDFEASVRQPLGRVFVPEAEHRKLTAPSVVTKLGTVIDPIGDEALLQNYDKLKNKNLKSKFETKRIQKKRGNKKLMRTRK